MINKLLFLLFILHSSFFIVFPQDVDKAWEFFDAGQYEKAAIEFENALSLIEKELGPLDTSLYSKTLIIIADSYCKCYRYLKAEKYYLQAKAIYEYENSTECNWYLVLISNLARLYQDIGDYEKSELLLIKVLEINRKAMGEEHSDYTASLNSLAELYIHMGNYNNAKSILLRILEISKKVLGEEHPNYAVLLNNLGLLYEKTGSYEKAESMLVQALEIRKKTLGEKHPYYAISLNNLALLYNDIGNFEKAETLFLQALEIIKKIDGEEHSNYALIMNNLASLYEKMGNYKKAGYLYTKALEISKKLHGDKHLNYATCLSNLVALLYKVGEYEKAESLFLQVLEIFEKALGDEHPDYAISLCNLALLYQDMGNYEKAIPLYLQALDIVGRVLGEGHPHYGLILKNLTSLYLKIGDYEKAELMLVKAIAVARSQIEQQLVFLSETEMANYLKDAMNTYSAYQSFFLQLKTLNPVLTGESYKIELITKGLLLHSGMQMRQNILNAGDTTIIRIYNNWQALRKSLANQYSLPIEKRTLDIKVIEEEANALEKQLTRSSRIFAQGQQFLKTNWKDIQSTLIDNESAIEFSSFQYYDGKRWTDSTYYVALVLRKNDKYPQMIYLCEEKQLDSILNQASGNDVQKTKQLYSTKGIVINGKTQSSCASSKLYDLVWSPIDSLLNNINTVYFSPSGLLHKISFAAIKTPDSMCLLDKYKLVQLGSTAEIVGSEKEDRYITVSDTAFFCGGINYDQRKTDKGIEEEKELFVYNRGPQISNESTRSISWRYLPGTYREARYIDSLFRKNKISTALYSDSSATETLVKNLSGKGPQIIHLSTHGYFFPEPKKEKPNDAFIKMGEETYRFSENPLLRSGLILAGANYVWKGGEQTPGQDDGILTAYEVSNMNLYNTKLVVLSACETGLGDIKGSEGVFGLQRAFKMAGVDYIIMSLWKVSDKETTEFMKLFYSNCLSNHSIRESFYLTQTTMRNKYDPYYWAAFVLME